MIKKIRVVVSNETHDASPKKRRDKDYALSKNEGKDIKYRLRKQEEKEHDELIKDFLERTDDEIHPDEDGSHGGCE